MTSDEGDTANFAMPVGEHPTFDPGDLCIVRKQVKSDAAARVSAKLVFKTSGPYRVLE
jgi:hypothetical protein